MLPVSFFVQVIPLRRQIATKSQRNIPQKTKTWRLSAFMAKKENKFRGHH
jgi:hypothetical protein